MKKISTLVILNLILFSFSFKCGHDQFLNKTLKPIEIIKKNSTIRSTRESEYSPINIYVDYSFVSNSRTVSDSVLRNIKSAMNDTVKMFSTLLNVKSSGILRYKESLKQCQKHFGISQVLSDGIEADMVIFPIVLSESELGEGVIASAGACLTSSDDKRPVAGVVQLGEKHNFSSSNYMKYFKMILLHEMTHIFVFSPTLFELFPQSDYYTKKTIGGVQRVLIKTPKVLQVARKHFDCNNLEGVELENQGGEGSVGSHWESRIMLGDYMISTDYEDTVVSEITLALFEDSGWYKVNYYTGDLFKFGKGEGCSFLNDKCIISGKVQFEDEYCINASEGKCYQSRTGKGICGIFNYTSELPEEYQYFDDPKIGGFQPADYCPVAYSMGSKTTGYLQNHCRYGSPTITGANEVFGEKSMCIEGVTSSQKISLCYEVGCSSDKIEIKVGEESIVCEPSEEGKKKEVQGYKDFSLICPNPKKVCPGTVFCNDAESCILNHSGSSSDLSSGFLSLKIITLGILSFTLI